MSDLAREMESAMVVLGAQVQAQMFGISRAGMASDVPKMLRLKRRDLQALTFEELESAMLGANGARWEHWPEEGTALRAHPFADYARLICISGWDPFEPESPEARRP